MKFSERHVEDTGLERLYTRLLHKSWHVIVTRTPTFRWVKISN